MHLSQKNTSWRRIADAENQVSLCNICTPTSAGSFPKLEDKARKTMACDYFVDALNDPMLELKIQEKALRRLDAAYKKGVQPRDVAAKRQRENYFR